MYPPRYWQKFIDQWFGSKYLLKEFLGCGAFGAVFRADEMLAERVMQSVAIKIVVADMERLDEQLAELQLSVRLRHPHLINGITCEQGDLGGDLCLGLVMELADQSLESYVQAHPHGLSVETVKTIASHLAQGLAVLHKDGIVHRDLKPANVLLVGDVWKLADFSIARSLEGKTSTQTNASQQIGTIAYMPPEAYSGKISPAWDLWSLGVMIHELATGRHPFPTQSAPELMRMVLTEEPQIDQSLLSPPGEIVAGCLIKEPKQRWQAPQVLAAFRPKPSVIQYPSPSRPRNLETIVENLGRDVILELVQIPADSYSVQNSENTVRMEKLAIGKYPVTQAQYKEVMGQNPSSFKGNFDNPVETVNWYDAQNFCQKLSKSKEKTYRLPNKLEWQCACRAGTDTKYHFGDDSNSLRDYAWFSDNSEKRPHSVGLKKPNLWELYDMHGNVWEWCEDELHDNIDVFWDDDGKKILCGGSWKSLSKDCSLLNCGRYYPDNKYDHYGFRVVLDLSNT